MTIEAHLLISWLTTVEVLKNRRERVLSTLAGVAPDLDGLGIVSDMITSTTNYYIEYHHYLGHSIFSAIIFASIASIFAKTQQLRVWILSFVVVHIHILCDIVGSKAPDGFHYPIYYLYPIDPNFSLIWEHQWELNSWQNIVIFVALLALSFFYLKRKRITFLEVISKRLNKVACRMYERYL